MIAFGDRAYRFAIASDVDRRALAVALRGVHGVTDVILAEELGAVTFEDVDPSRGVEGVLAAPPHGPMSEGARHVVRVAYDGADLDDLPAFTKDLHAAGDYQVAMLGFLPGFAYLRGLDPRLAEIPRRAHPRPRVPARAVAMAAGYTGIYPGESPGGWHLLGTAHALPAFDLGDRVTFTPSGPAPPLPPMARPSAAGAALEVLKVVGPAFAVAGAIEVHGQLTVALGGREIAVANDGRTRFTRLVAEIERFDGPLRRGDRLATRSTAASVAAPAVTSAAIEIMEGPDAVIDTLLTTTFRISPTSDRTGTRLEGFVPALPHAYRSAPMVVGAVEATPSGLVVLGPDAPRTGGYPVVAVLRASAREAFFSRPVGAEVSFR